MRPPRPPDSRSVRRQRWPQPWSVRSHALPLRRRQPTGQCQAQVSRCTQSVASSCDPLGAVPHGGLIWKNQGHPSANGVRCQRQAERIRQVPIWQQRGLVPELSERTSGMADLWVAKARPCAQAGRPLLGRPSTVSRVVGAGDGTRPDGRPSGRTRESSACALTTPLAFLEARPSPGVAARRPPGPRAGDVAGAPRQAVECLTARLRRQVEDGVLAPHRPFLATGKRLLVPIAHEADALCHLV